MSKSKHGPCPLAAYRLRGREFSNCSSVSHVLTSSVKARCRLLLANEIEKTEVVRELSGGKGILSRGNSMYKGHEVGGKVIREERGPRHHREQTGRGQRGHMWPSDEV